MHPESCHAHEDDRINSWVTSTQEHSFPPSPPLDEVALKPVPSKRKRRAMSLPTTVPVPNSHRSDSPKRRRIEPVDDVLPEQSASQLSSNRPFPLHDKNTFSPPTSRLSSSPKRSSSPTRETPIILRSALPPVVIESPNGLQVAPPTHVERLGDLLADGVDSGFIPKGLEVLRSLWFWLVRHSYHSSKSSRTIRTWATKSLNRPTTTPAISALLTS
jgi:hypothetical protein